MLRLLLLLVVGATVLSALESAEQRGKRIFEQGVGTHSPPVTAVPVGGDIVSASVLPCANCHGRDGRGKPEAGIVPSDITWETLTRPYPVTHAGGRTSAPYTERLLRRAFTLGFDSAGNTLQPSMPRFQLSLEDASDLIAYMKQLGHVPEPGVTPDSVRLGVIHLPGVPEVRTLLSQFNALNAAGGMFGRRIDLVFLELPVDATRRAEAVRNFLAAGEIFAVGFADLTGAEGPIADVFSQSNTPAIAARAAFPAAPDRNVFYLDGGVTTDQVPSDKQRAAAAAEVIVEGLKRAGRTLTRAGLIDALETFNNVNNSYGRPITFSATRHIGIIPR